MSNTRVGRAHISIALRNEVAKRDRGICQLCGVRATRAELTPKRFVQFFDADGRSFHIDHIRALVVGGATDLSNLRLLCAPCNLRRCRGSAVADPEIHDLLSEFDGGDA